MGGWTTSTTAWLLPWTLRALTTRQTRFAQSEGMAPGLADDIIILPWNNKDILRQTLDLQGDEVAAIITEPIMCNTNCILPKPGYLEEMRRLCDEHGVVLIFDEVINGFRVALGGGQELTGVTPDIATFAKAIAADFRFRCWPASEKSCPFSRTGQSCTLAR